MSDSYLLMHNEINECVGELIIDAENENYDFRPNENYRGEQPQFIQYNSPYLTQNEQIKMWVLNRSPEPNYAFIDALIQKAGLKTYDPYGFFKYNQGRFNTDEFYVVPV